MCSTKNHICKILCLGLMSLVLLSVLLFWARKVCQIITYEALVFGHQTSIEISPVGLYPDEVEEKLARGGRPSLVKAGLRKDGFLFGTLGSVADMKEPGKKRYYTGRTSLIQSDDIWAYNPQGGKGAKHAYVLYFAKAEGLFVYSKISWQEDEGKWSKTIN